MKLAVLVLPLSVVCGCTTSGSKHYPKWSEQQFVISVVSITDWPLLASVWLHDQPGYDGKAPDVDTIGDYWIVDAVIDSPDEKKGQKLSILVPATISREKLVAEGWGVPQSQFRIDLFYSEDAKVLWENIRKAERIANKPFETTSVTRPEIWENHPYATASGSVSHG